MASIEYAIGRAFPQAEDFLTLALEVLSKHPQNEWFTATNGTGAGNEFDICRDLSGAGIIAQRRLPVWKENGLFGGYIIQHLWKDNLRYQDEK